MENFGRRQEDRGKENPLVILARIDMNIEYLKSGAEAVKIQLHEHEKQDDDKFGEMSKKFDEIFRAIWMVSGGACVVMFILNWFHK